MKFPSHFLFPFAVLYQVVTSIRNAMYDRGLKPVARFEVPVISVGNLSAGGTGKTPMIEYLIRLLTPCYQVATLSRGYGRNTKGIRIANELDTPASVGDEPHQLYSKFKDKVRVAVGEERAFAIPHILNLHPEVNLILLDDAFQHRKVKPAFQILLTDFHHLFTKDFLLPAGRLRESRAGADRADVIVVTKCPPHITDEEMIEIGSDIRKYSRKAVFFSTISYGNILPVADLYTLQPEKVILVTGIASAAPLVAYVSKKFTLVKHFNFPDHHAYTAGDMKQICEAAREEQAVVITTEKDISKLDSGFFASYGLSLNYIPIETEFLKDGKEFDEMILNVLRRHAS